MNKIEIRNSLMITVQDDEGAFELAHSFVDDDYNKLMVFNRIFAKTKIGPLLDRSKESVAKSISVWEHIAD